MKALYIFWIYFLVEILSELCGLKSKSESSKSVPQLSQLHSTKETIAYDLNALRGIGEHAEQVQFIKLPFGALEKIRELGLNRKKCKNLLDQLQKLAKKRKGVNYSNLTQVAIEDKYGHDHQTNIVVRTVNT